VVVRTGDIGLGVVGVLPIFGEEDLFTARRPPRFSSRQVSFGGEEAYLKLLGTIILGKVRCRHQRKGRVVPVSQAQVISCPARELRTAVAGSWLLCGAWAATPNS
jgi:hypothetical protein